MFIDAFSYCHLSSRKHDRTHQQRICERLLGTSRIQGTQEPASRSESGAGAKNDSFGEESNESARTLEKVGL